MPKRKLVLPDDGERVYSHLVSGISRALNKMLRDERAYSGLDRSMLAEKMKVDKGFISRKLAGSNMELRTIAAFLAWAGWEMEVDVHRIDAPPNSRNNDKLFSALKPAPITPSPTANSVTVTGASDFKGATGTYRETSRLEPIRIL